jgi:hypothetical protein
VQMSSRWGCSGLQLVAAHGRSPEARKSTVLNSVRLPRTSRSIGRNGDGVMLAEVGIPPGAALHRGSQERAVTESDEIRHRDDIGEGLASS